MGRTLTRGGDIWLMLTLAQWVTDTRASNSFFDEGFRPGILSLSISLSLIHQKTGPLIPVRKAWVTESEKEIVRQSESELEGKKERDCESNWMQMSSSSSSYFFPPLPPVELPVSVSLFLFSSLPFLTLVPKPGFPQRADRQRLALGVGRASTDAAAAAAYLDLVFLLDACALLPFTLELSGAKTFLFDSDVSVGVWLLSVPLSSPLVNWNFINTIRRRAELGTENDTKDSGSSMRKWSPECCAVPLSRWSEFEWKRLKKKKIWVVLSLFLFPSEFELPFNCINSSSGDSLLLLLLCVYFQISRILFLLASSFLLIELN